MVEKCSHCEEYFVIKTMKKYYVYKLKQTKTHKMSYFCSYSCMQTEKRNNPRKYIKER